MSGDINTLSEKIQTLCKENATGVIIVVLILIVFAVYYYKHEGFSSDSIAGSRPPQVRSDTVDKEWNLEAFERSVVLLNKVS